MDSYLHDIKTQDTENIKSALCLVADTLTDGATAHLRAQSEDDWTLTITSPPMSDAGFQCTASDIARALTGRNKELT